MNKQQKLIDRWFPAAVVLLLALLPLLSVSNVFAATTGTVAATVTPRSISVAVSDGSVSYGTVDVSSSADTTTSGVNDSQTATNDGNITEDFNIRSTDATGGTTWTLAGTSGADQYVHSFCTTTCDSTPSWTSMTTSYQQLANAVASSGNNVFDLQIETPSSVSDYVQKSITVTIQAVID